MKITLISMDSYLVSYGVRCISSYLKEHGFDVSIIFTRDIMNRDISGNVMEGIADKCRGSDIIGISLMSYHFLHAVELTSYLKKRLDVPIIWGGIHPTFCPDDSIGHADIVCIGEGEETMLELSSRIRDGLGYFDIKGLWFAKDGEVVKTPSRPLFEDIDRLPYPDYETKGNFIRDGDCITDFTDGLFEKYLRKRKRRDGSYVTEYYISTSRGCPFKCSFCSSNSIKGLYPGQKFHRLRSVDKVICEVNTLVKRYGFIKWINFSDDDIFTSPMQRTAELCEKWKKSVGLPFYCTCYPTSYNEQKMSMLVDAGLEFIGMGIQTISKRGCEAFDRSVSKENLMKVTRSISLFKGILPPLYDFILDNPYETDEDRIENLNFMLEIPEPRAFQLFSLVPFPGTAIYNRMEKDGIISRYHDKIYKSHYTYPDITYINFLLFLVSNHVAALYHVSPRVIKVLTGRIPLFIFNNRGVKFLLSSIPYNAVIWTVRNFITREHLRFNKATHE